MTFHYLAVILVLAGLLVLVAALSPVGQLIRQLPSGSVRRNWIFQAGLIVLFVLGYIGYEFTFWNEHSHAHDLIVPGVFFLGAGFVWRTVTLALHTAADVRRVTLLEQENITDSLIGVYNRRYMDRRLEEEFQRAQRHNIPLSLLLIDIDHFKRVNDTYGHPVGDRVLRYLGGLILGVVRATDIVARYGGEEILVIAPGAGPAAAMAMAERARATIEAHELILSRDAGARQGISITVSIGVVSLSKDCSEVQQLLENADQALYRAKRLGRNRVEQYVFEHMEEAVK